MMYKGGEIKMGDFNDMLSIVKNITILNIIDIVIVAYIFYKFYILIKQTRAEQLIKGLFFIVILMKGSELFGLVTLHWIIQSTFTVGIIALVIIFQPELRKALEHLGRAKLLVNPLFENDEEIEKAVNEVISAVVNLAKTNTGALIIIEQETGLNDFMENGVLIDAFLSAGLLENIFVENTPLHDGGVIIRKDRIFAAACVLPLTDKNVAKELGTRHRAAIGISEHCDAIAIVVSEETGNISIAIGGKLTRNYNAERLKMVLFNILKRNMSIDTSMFRKVKKWLEKTHKK